MDNLDFVLADIKAKSPRDYYIILLAPTDQQRALITFYGLNLQLKQAIYATSEPAMRQIRLQYWKDQLTNIVSGRDYDDVPVLVLCSDILMGNSAVLKCLHCFIDEKLTISDTYQTFTDFYNHEIACAQLYWKCLYYFQGKQITVDDDVWKYYALSHYIMRTDSALRTNAAGLPADFRESFQLTSNLYALGKANIEDAVGEYLSQLDHLWLQICKNSTEKLDDAYKTSLLFGHLQHLKLRKCRSFEKCVHAPSVKELIRLIWMRFKYRKLF